MKKIFFVFFLCVTTYAYSQNGDVEKQKFYRHTLTSTITNLFVSNFQLNYEFGFSPITSLKISFGTSYVDADYNKKNGYNGELQFKYYILSPDREKTYYNIYFAPYINYRYIDVTTDDYSFRNNDITHTYPLKSFNFNSLSGGFIFGQTFTIAKKIFIDLYLGGGIRKNLYPDEYLEQYNSNIFQEGYSGITGKLGLDIGFKF